MTAAIRTPRLLAVSGAILLASSPAARSASIMETHTFAGLALAVPDGNPAGMANVQNVTSTITGIESVTVNLQIGGTFNGDLYVYLTHGSGYSVLLNRPGRTGANVFGYNDDGIEVLFSDLAPANVHTYQAQGIPAPGTPLTGLWQPDGRAVDPDLVVDTDPVTATLASFAGGNASGDWILFVADLSGGDDHVLQGWSLQLTGVPEPSGVVLAAFGLGVLVLRRRR